MRKGIALSAAVEKIPDGSSLTISGFIGIGSPNRLIGELVRQGREGFTVTANDTACPGFGIGRLIDAKLVRMLVVSHIGTNPETQREMIAGEIAVDIVPQGTLGEHVRAAGCRLGGVLTADWRRNPRCRRHTVDRGRGQAIPSGAAYCSRFRSDRCPPCRLPRKCKLRADSSQPCVSLRSLPEPVLTLARLGHALHACTSASDGLVEGRPAG